MPTLQERIETATDLIEADSAKLNAVVHGPASGAGSEVPTDGGNVKTIARAVADGEAAVAAAGGGVSLLYKFDSATAMADPGTADLRLNDAVLANATAIAVSALMADAGNPDASAFIATWGDSLHDIRGVITIRKASNPAVFAQLGVNGPVTDNGTWLQIPVAHIASSGALADTDPIYVGFVPSGNDGEGQVTTVSGGDGIVVGGTLADPVVSIDKADQATAEAGADHVKVMTSLRVKQAIDVAIAAIRNGVSAAYDTLAELADAFTTLDSVALKQGVHALNAPARSWVPQPTNGCANLAKAESATNKVVTEYLAFDPAVIEYAQWGFDAPKSVDETASISGRIEWMEPSGATSHDAVWQVEAQAQGNGDAIDSAWGAAVTCTDTGSDGTRRFASFTGLAVSGFAERDKILIRLSRKATDAADTLNTDAWFIEAQLEVAFNAGNDA